MEWNKASLRCFCLSNRLSTHLQNFRFKCFLVRVSKILWGEETAFAHQLTPPYMKNKEDSNFLLYERLPNLNQQRSLQNTHFKSERYNSFLPIIWSITTKMLGGKKFILTERQHREQYQSKKQLLREERSHNGNTSSLQVSACLGWWISIMPSLGARRNAHEIIKFLLMNVTAFPLQYHIYH